VTPIEPVEAPFKALHIRRDARLGGRRKEAYEIRAALPALAKGLAEAGYAPR